MVAAGVPLSSPIKKPSGSTAAKQASSARPGFQPSAAAHFTAIEISSGRIVRMLRSFIAGDRTNVFMNQDYHQPANNKTFSSRFEFLSFHTARSLGDMVAQHR